VVQGVGAVFVNHGLRAHQSARIWASLSSHK
jgi:hypothetical protein